MPTYEYHCSKCDHQFETFQSMKDKPLSVCPKDLCGAKRWGKGKVKRQLGSGAGLIFKGSGFYITEYRSENYKQAAKKDAPPTASGDGKGGETKSAPASTPAAESKSAGHKAEAKPAKKRH